MARAHPSTDNLHALLTARAGHDPDKPAILEAVDGGAFAEVSYRELTVLIERHAAVLDGLGLDVGDRVLVESNTSAGAVATLLACAQLGLPFVPVSPETPDGRVAAIVESVEPALYVKGFDAQERAWLGAGQGTARLSTSTLTVERKPLHRVRHREAVLAGDSAYIIFTSGTTGRPKGVVMSHRSIVAFLRAVLADGLASPRDRIASTSPLQFDFALFDIGIALGAGATLVPMRRDLVSSPRRMVAMLRAARVTQIDGVPSIWRPILRHFPELLSELESLRTIVFAGEEFPLRELRKLQSVRPDVRVINGYGATESMACSFTEVPNPIPADQRHLSIASVHPGAEVALIGRDGEVVAEPGAVGEIYLRSPALFSGYWNDREATAAVLVPDPVDPRHGPVVLRTGDLAYRDGLGGLYFCGRVDAQVQIRGNRVELGEVEAVLERHPGVRGAAAVAATNGSGDAVLAAFIAVAGAPADFDIGKARTYCEQELPAYMVPKEIHPVTDLPLTAHGKVDRATLLGMIPARRRDQDRTARHIYG